MGLRPVFACAVRLTNICLYNLTAFFCFWANTVSSTVYYVVVYSLTLLNCSYILALLNPALAKFIVILT